MNQEQRIEYFMSEIARLSNQVVYLQDERDSLAAQVEALRAALGNLHDIASRCDGWESFPQKALDAAADVLAATPQQHLAEIRAEAVLVAANSCLFMASINTDDGVVNREICLFEDLEQYAELAKDGDV